MPDHNRSRIVQLSSVAHRQGRIHFADLQSEKHYSRNAAYCQSKLACLMFADELDLRLRHAGRKIISVAAHPGVADTELGKHVPRLLYKLLHWTVLPLITHSPKQAALPILMAALDADIAGGDYFGPKGFKELTGLPGIAKKMPHALDKNVRQHLWVAAETLTGTPFAIEKRH